MGTIVTEATGRAAAFQAIRALWYALMMLNRTDLPDMPEGGRPVGLIYRLAHQAPGTPYQLANDALLGALDAYLGKGRDYSEEVLYRLIDTGESVEWCIRASERDADALAAEEAERARDYWSAP